MEVLGLQALNAFNEQWLPTRFEHSDVDHLGDGHLLDYVMCTVGACTTAGARVLSQQYEVEEWQGDMKSDHAFLYWYVELPCNWSKAVISKLKKNSQGIYILK